MVVSDGRDSASSWGRGAAADNWAWDSVATKQHGLGNEINDVVLGLVSPRRGLSPNSLPKVKERLVQLGTSMVARMRKNNPLIREIVEIHESNILNNIIHGQNDKVRSHRSPLDIILPASRPFLSSN